MKKGRSEVKEIILKKSHKYLSDAIKYSLPHGRINKQYTGIGATSYEITDVKRNSIIVCPTVALASGKADWARNHFNTLGNGSVFYLGSNSESFNGSDPCPQIIMAIQSNRLIKILAVVDTFVKVFNGPLKEYIKHFHLFIDEADTLQIDSLFRPVMEDCFDLYFQFPKNQRTLITATPIGSVLKKIKEEPECIITKEGYEKPSLKVIWVEGYLPYIVGRNIKEQLYKNRGTKLLVAVNSFDLIQEIMIAGKLEYNEVCIACSESSYDKVKSLFCQIEGGKLPPTGKVIFITSAYFVGIDIEDPVIIHIVSDPRYEPSILSPQKIYQICGRSRAKCQSRYFYFSSLKSVSKVKTLEGLIEESKKQYEVLSNLPYSKKGYRIDSYASGRSGSFYRLVDGQLKRNNLLFDLRLDRYKTRKELYSKGSDPRNALSEYFDVTLSRLTTLDMTSKKVLRLQVDMKAYKVELFKNTLLFPDKENSSYFINPYIDKPFSDRYMALYTKIRDFLPVEARQSFYRWVEGNVEEYNISKLKKLHERILKYSYPISDKEEMQKLLHEFRI